MYEVTTVQGPRYKVTTIPIQTGKGCNLYEKKGKSICQVKTTLNATRFDRLMTSLLAAKLKKYLPNR